MERIGVAGNRLVAPGADGVLRPVRLRGINRSGLQHKPSLAHAGMADPAAELRAWRQRWRVDVVRLPLALDLVIERPEYRRDIDRVVDAAAQAGVHLVLELHGTTTDLGPPLPPAWAAQAAWMALAEAYGGAPHVMFDLFNEPHDVTWAAWRALAETCVRAIRSAGALDTLVIVGGLHWGYDLSAIEDPAQRVDGLGPIAYATHPYPMKGPVAHREAEWERFFGAAARHVPVIVGEFGADASGTVPHGFTDAATAAAWVRALLAFVDAHELSALAWSAGDAPHLVHGTSGARVSLPLVPPDPDAPTEPFGRVVREWLGAPTAMPSAARVA